MFIFSTAFFLLGGHVVDLAAKEKNTAKAIQGATMIMFITAYTIARVFYNK